MIIHPLIKNNFTEKEIEKMINMSSIHYNENSEDVDYFIFSLENDKYIEVRTDRDNMLEIIDCSLQDTEEIEKDIYLTKKHLFSLLNNKISKPLTQMDID